jgi:putative phosphoesterase
MPTRLGVVSDTHGHVGYALDAVRALTEQRVDVVIHCGDIGSPKVVPLFAGWPAHYVFGNVDYDDGLLRAAINDAGQTCHGRFGELELEGKSIAFLHSDDALRFREVVRSGKYDLVCYGHTHVAKVQQLGRTLVLNPGAMYRAERHTIAIVELPSLEVRHLPADSASS